MLAVWGYVEADFRRDYGICLLTDLPHMSWHEFKTLLFGLSPFSALATNYDALIKHQEELEERETHRQNPRALGFWNMIASYKPDDR